jgi:hypothetical protein
MDWMPDVFMKAIGWLLTPLAALMKLMHDLLPDPVAAAFKQIEAGGDFLMGLRWLNWFLPLEFMAATFGVFVGIMVIYYGYTLTIRVGLRFVHAS